MKLRALAICIRTAWLKQTPSLFAPVLEPAPLLVFRHPPPGFGRNSDTQ